jgi:hypothetical protein
MYGVCLDNGWWCVLLKKLQENACSSTEVQGLCPPPPAAGAAARCLVGTPLGVDVEPFYYYYNHLWVYTAGGAVLFKQTLASN